VLATDVQPFALSGSGGSTPLRITVKADSSTTDEESCIFGKLYAATHVRSDRWYKLGRALLYGRLEDEKPFHSVRRLVQYEDYILRLFSEAGLPVPHPLGIVEITPEREYLLVAEFIVGAKEVGEAEIDDSIIDQGLLVVRRMWDIGMAHRDIKPANLLVRGRTLFMIDSAFAEVRPSPWRQAVDLANMMLTLALRTDAERVYRRARLQFSDEEIAEAFAATRGLTMPSQLRRMLRQQGRDLHADFLRLLPYRLPPVRIQRWTWRRVGLVLTTLAAAVLLAGITVTILGSPL
jgi:tRNA A-37 threonylcarbamoyl transferase component Bud32